jgi:GAF domain-containing protein
LEAALEATVLAFQGVGGRLYLLPEQKTSTQSSAEPVNSGVLADAQLYTYGVQPATSAFTKYAAIEQYHVWHNYFQAHDDLVWAVTDLYQEPELHSLQAVFQPTPIGSLLIILLLYRQQVLGYLSIFRNGGYSQTSAIAQPSPTNALDHGRGQAAMHPTQARPWTEAEIEMGQALGMHFAAAVQRSQGQTQLQTLTTSLEQQVQERTLRLQQLVDRQQALLRVITKIRQSLDIDTIFRTTTREVCRIVQAERVAVYRFNADWGGEFVNDFEFASSNWNGLSKLGVNLVWNDTYLQETQGGRYRFKETFVVDDIYTAGLSPCHVEVLEQYQVRSHAIAPIFVGKRLWGLLAMYQSSGPRHWSEEDVKFLNHVTEQLGVALQQADLFCQTQQQAEQLQQQAERQQMLLRVVTKIRQSLDTDTIFRTTTQEVCQVVQAERVAVYRFNADWGGEFVNDFEFASSNWNGLSKLGVNLVWNDTYLQETQGGRYRHKETFVVDDVYQIEMSPCHLEILEQYQVRAQVLAPIFVSKQLWGLLAMYQHSSPRHWSKEDVKFFNHVAEQLGVALKQANLVNQPELSM